MPEGKGVSSSAAVEVATMSAIAAAHGAHLSLFLSFVTIIGASLSIYIKIHFQTVCIPQTFIGVDMSLQYN